MRTCRATWVCGVLALSFLVVSSRGAAGQVAAVKRAVQPLDPLQMVYACRDACKSVKDFTAVMHRQERLWGQLQPMETIFVKFRNQPFSVYMKWMKEPHKTREAIYVANQNDGKIVAHEVAGLVNWMRKVSPNAPEARKQSHHPITEAGIGKAIESLIRVCDKAKQAGDLKLFCAGQDSFDNRPTDLLVRILPQKPEYPYHVIILHIDKGLGLPVKFVSLNWDYEVETNYSYTDLKLNVGLTDEDFDYKNKEYGYQSLVGLRFIP